MPLPSVTDAGRATAAPQPRAAPRVPVGPLIPGAAALAAQERRIGLFCALGALAVWACFPLVSRHSTRSSLTPWDVAALRYAGAFVTVLPLVARFGWPGLPPARAAALVATAAFGYPLLAYVGFGFAPASHAGVLLAGALPFLGAALGAALGTERWTRWRALSLVMAAVGMALLGADTMGAYPGAWRGDLLFLAATACWAVYTLLVRRWRVAALRAVLAVALYAAPLFLPVWWLLLPSGLAEAGWRVAAWQFFFQGSVAVVVAGFLFTRAVNALGAATTTAVTALVPALAALAAWPLLDEPLGLAGLAGVALVSAGMLAGVRAAGHG